MARSPQEIQDTTRFIDVYRRAQSPAMLEVEEITCGCRYGATSWATLDEVREITKLLGLGPNTRLLEIGAGSGWPSLHMAESSGCDAVLTDLPISGIRIANDRARTDGLGGRCFGLLADGAHLPFADAVFDAVHHADVLCCLKSKREVLQNCRRVIRPGAKMAFSVIFMVPDLPPSAVELAVAAGPPFMDMEGDYPALLADTGWHLTSTQDLTNTFLATARRSVLEEEARATELSPLHDGDDFVARLNRHRAKIAALERGLIRRELYLAEPV